MADAVSDNFSGRLETEVTSISINSSRLSFFNALGLFYFGFPGSLDFNIGTKLGALLWFLLSRAPDELELSYSLLLSLLAINCLVTAASYLLFPFIWKN